MANFKVQAIHSSSWCSVCACSYKK